MFDSEHACQIKQQEKWNNVNTLKYIEIQNYMYVIDKNAKNDKNKRYEYRG